MKNNKPAFFAVAISAMLGMGAIEANAQQTRYKGTVTIHQKDGTTTSFKEADFWNIQNRDNYVYVASKNTQPTRFNNVDHVSFKWLAHEISNISINYKKDISYEEANAASKALCNTFDNAQIGIFGLRGGKGGGFPEPHVYQFQYSFGPDCYVQYFCVPHSDFPYSNFTLRSTYDLCKGCIGGAGDGFSKAKWYIAPALNDKNIEMLPEMKAIYLILFNYSAIENADLFGPMPYIDNIKLKQESPFTYDNVRDIYYTVKVNLDSAVNCLKYFSGKRPDNVPNRDTDYKGLIYQTIAAQIPLLKTSAMPTDNLEPFIRFANSLKLRMAIHMSKVEPATAKQWAEEAVAGGVIENEADEIGLFPSRFDYDHPLVDITNWRDIVMGASFINLLQNLDHPYMKYLFTKNSIALEKSKQAVSGTSAPATTSEGTVFIGMRNGVIPGEGQAASTNPYCGYSTLDRTYFSECNPPLYLMKVSEVNFLRAEGALRGWNMGGTAQSFYEQGIRTAYLEDRNFPIKKYVNYVDDYLNVVAPKGIAYVDPQGLTPDMPSVTKIGVKWNEGDSKETKLEKIITQKYIASFPYSYESWVDLRRTGYPKLFPILNTEHSDGTIKPGDPKVQTADNIMRRIPWVPDDPQTKEDINATGIPALSEDTNNKPATDTQMQRLWWDVDAPNF